MWTKELADLKVGALQVDERSSPHPGGNADVYQNKWIAGKAICKTMKTKAHQKSEQGGQNRIVADTHGVAEKGRDQEGTLVRGTLVGRLPHP
jgi:hypothetical protein